MNKINLVVSQNNKMIEEVVMEVNPHPAYMVKSLQEFQQRANTALTNLIEDPGQSGDDMEEIDDDDDDEDEDVDDIQVSPKKRKK